MLRIATPVYDALATDKLKERMPIEHHPKAQDRGLFTHLEALGRSLAGIVPWLELTDLSPDEAAQRNRLASVVIQSLRVATDPASRDFMNFTKGNQPLVDSAFLALHKVCCVAGTASG